MIFLLLLLYKTNPGHVLGLLLHNVGDKVLIMMQRNESSSINIHVSYFQKKYEDEVFTSRLVTTEVVHTYKYKYCTNDSSDAFCGE